MAEAAVTIITKAKTIAILVSITIVGVAIASVKAATAEVSGCSRVNISTSRT